MTKKMTIDLFKNASLTEAFYASLKNPSQKVVFKGRSWVVGKKEFSVKNDKLSSVRTFFLQLGHKLRMCCSFSYKKNFNTSIKKFDTAQGKACKEKVAQEQKIAFEILRGKEQIKQLSESIVKKQNEMGQCKLEMESARTAQQNCILGSPEMKALEEQIGLLEQLKGSLEFYLQQKEREIKPTVSNIFEDGFNSLVNSIIPDAHLGEENQLPQDITTLASIIFDGIPFTKDTNPYSNRIDEKIKEISVLQTKLMGIVDVNHYDLKLKALQENLTLLQTQLAKASAIQLTQKQEEVKSLLPQNAVQSLKTSKATELFLNELEKITSKDMREAWESLLLNLTEKYGQGIIVNFKKYKSKKLELTFKQPLSIYMLPCDLKGQESYEMEPIGGSILKMEKSLTFSTSSKNLLNIEGLSSWARIPKQYVKLANFLRLGEYTQVSLYTMETAKKELIITASKVGQKYPRSTPIDAIKTHWRAHGEVPSKEPEKFLADKRAEYLRKGLIKA